MSEALPGMPEPPPPRPPRDAAVAVLVRPGAGGPEVFWLRRDVTVSFAAGIVTGRRTVRYSGPRDASIVNSPGGSSTVAPSAR